MRRLVATALPLMAAQTSAQISFESGQIDIQGTGTAGASLGVGAQMGNFSFVDYSACDGREEFCLTLPYGGRYANGSYAINVNDAGLSYRFDLWQGSDIGGPLSNDYVFEATFLSNRAVRLYTSGRSRFEASADCVGCNRTFDIASASATQLSDGLWEISFFAFMQGNTGIGGQSLLQEGRLKIASVPEPGNWAMMITGLGLIGVALRRRVHCAV